MNIDYVNGGELFTHLCQRGKFSEPETRFYISEITLALATLHKVRASYSFLFSFISTY